LRKIEHVLVSSARKTTQRPGGVARAVMPTSPKTQFLAFPAVTQPASKNDFEVFPADGPQCSVPVTSLAETEMVPPLGSILALHFVTAAAEPAASTDHAKTPMTRRAVIDVMASASPS